MLLADWHSEMGYLGQRTRLACWFRRLAETIFWEESAKAGRFRQHARRVRYPEATYSAHDLQGHVNANLCDALNSGSSNQRFNAFANSRACSRNNSRACGIFPPSS